MNYLDNMFRCRPTQARGSRCRKHRVEQFSVSRKTS